MTGLPAPTVPAAMTAFRHGVSTEQTRTIPEETALAISYDRVGYAVMMATPRDVEDFAVGFSLAEGIVDCTDDIIGTEIVTVEQGVECRIALARDMSDRLAKRRRHLAGAMGCGLCGLESLAEANRALPVVRSSLTLSADTILRGMRALGAGQSLNRQTHGIHAAAFLDPGTGALLIREDVGRHNALDKVSGALARAGRTGGAGAILLTSRISIELIQKCAILGTPVIAAISVPTAYAVRAAEAAGITLIAIARDDGFEVFTHPDRIRFGAVSNVA